ncbi:MAG: carbon-nitrogen hydrolase family protein [Thermoproteota archaeon]|nr:carbon-nitrogen hydrolase family protein [Thermoproteota archaeon]
MSRKFKVTLSQISCKVGDKKTNIKTMQTRVTQAKKRNAELIIFPELSLTGYTIRDLTYELAEPIPGPSVKALEKIAEKEEMYVVFGMLERSEKAQAVIYNTAVLLGPEGYVGKYQKMYLPTHSVFEEKRYFRQGYQASVFETNIGKLGIIICYDVFFPETSRLLRLKGAQFIICISASPAIRRKFFEILTTARAIENNAFFAYVNLVGIEEGLEFWGGSRLISPSGRIISQAKYNQEDLVTGSIDYADLQRVGVFVPTLRDLRPELFDQLKEQADRL